MTRKFILAALLAVVGAFGQLTPSLDDYVDAASTALEKPLLIAQDVDQHQFDTLVTNELASINDPARHGKYLGVLRFQGFLNNRKSIRLWGAQIRIQYGDQVYESWVVYLPTPNAFYWVVPPTQALADIDFQRLSVKLLKMLRNK